MRQQQGADAGNYGSLEDVRTLTLHWDASQTEEYCKIFCIYSTKSSFLFSQKITQVKISETWFWEHEMWSLTGNQQKKPTTTKPQYLASSALSEYFCFSFLSNFKGKWTAALCLLWRWVLKIAACTIIPDPAKMPVGDPAGLTELLGAEGRRLLAWCRVKKDG